MKIKWGTN